LPARCAAADSCLMASASCCVLWGFTTAWRRSSVHVCGRARCTHAAGHLWTHPGSGPATPPHAHLSIACEPPIHVGEGLLRLLRCGHAAPAAAEQQRCQQQRLPVSMLLHAAMTYCSCGGVLLLALSCCRQCGVCLGACGSRNRWTRRRLCVHCFRLGVWEAKQRRGAQSFKYRGIACSTSTAGAVTVRLCRRCRDFAKSAGKSDRAATPAQPASFSVLRRSLQHVCHPADRLQDRF
jgi:hypothetical protein